MPSRPSSSSAGTRRKRFPHLPGAAALAAALLLAACSSDPVTPGPGEVTDAAVIEFFSSGEPTVSVPDTVDAGVPFQVSVESYGDGCASRGPTEVSLSGNLAQVEPFDVFLRGDDVVCPAILRTFVHEASLVFSESGTTAEVRFLGRTMPDDTMITVTREVWVR